MKYIKTFENITEPKYKKGDYVVNVDVTLPTSLRDIYKDKLRKFLINRLGVIVRYNKSQSRIQNRNIYAVKYDNVPSELFGFMHKNSIREVTFEDELRPAEPYEIMTNKFNL